MSLILTKQDINDVLGYELLTSNSSINKAILEKDYWVFVMLDYLFTKCKYKDAFNFKGGTSLSKGYQLIERFSEDIDIVLDWRVLGLKIDEPYEERSKNQLNKFVKEIAKKTDDFLEKELLPLMKEDLKKLISDDFDIYFSDEVPRSINFVYPRNFDTGYNLPFVKLEISPLAIWSPSETTSIEPDLKKLLPDAFKDFTVEVRTVIPERTFWEKVSILQCETNRPAEQPVPKRYARHYYDVYCFAKSPYKERAFKKLELLPEVVNFTKRFYSRSWAKYDDILSKNINLVPNEQRIAELTEDYLKTKQMFNTGVTPPSFDEVIRVIKDLEAEVREVLGANK